ITWRRSRRGTSRRWRPSPPPTGCRRSRSSCSTAATGSPARATRTPLAGSGGLANTTTTTRPPPSSGCGRRGAATRSARELAEWVSVSLHCEVADILNAYTRLVRREGALTGLRAYSAARPPHSEGLGVWIASYLAHETGCPNVNLLHLSSRKALEAALMMQ